MIYDYIVIGSGFGGSVASLRLVEKGYKVLLLEQGKRYNPEDFPKSNWNIPKYLWIPSLRCFGFQKLSFYSTASIMSGTGVGGGSLVYANTLCIFRLIISLIISRGADLVTGKKYLNHFMTGHHLCLAERNIPN